VLVLTTRSRRSLLDTTKVTTTLHLAPALCVALICTDLSIHKTFHLPMMPGKRLAVEQVVQGMAVRVLVLRRTVLTGAAVDSGRFSVAAKARMFVALEERVTTYGNDVVFPVNEFQS